MEEAHSLDRKNFQTDCEEKTAIDEYQDKTQEKPLKCFVEEVTNDTKKYHNASLTKPEDIDSSMTENEPIYINVQPSLNDQNTVKIITQLNHL